MSVGNPSITPQVAKQINQAQAVQGRTNQRNQGEASARTNALKNTNAPALPAAAPAVAPGIAQAGLGPGGTTTPGIQGPAVRIGTPSLSGQQFQVGAQAAAMANAFSATFMAATGAVAVVTGRKKSSDVSGDLKEGEGSVGVETESEAQPDALQETDQEQGAGEITEAGSTSGPST